MLAFVRADGAEAGNCWIQVVPFQFQVSVNSTAPPPVLPPNRTTVCVDVSYAMGALRAEGLAAGFCMVQVFAIPSHVHVSPRKTVALLLPPPNKTTFPVAGSYAKPIESRADGDTGGNCWVQVAPSQVHVSLRSVPVLSSPPKSTMLPAAPSYTIPAPARADGEVA